MQIPTNPFYDIDEHGTVRLISTGEVVPECRNRHNRRSVKIRGKSHKPSSHPLDRLMLVTYKPLPSDKDPEWMSVKFLDGDRDNIEINNLEWDGTWYYPLELYGSSVPFDTWVTVHKHPEIQIKINKDGIFARNAFTWREIGFYESVGYFNLKNQTNGSKVLLHRLVALTFLPHPRDTDHLTVNHKDSNKSNNYPHNLEWATYSQNNFHAFSEGPRGETVKKLICLNLETNEEMTFSGYNEAARYLGVLPGSIHSVMDRRTFEGRPYKGHIFKYSDDDRTWKQLRESGPIIKRSLPEKIAVRDMDTGRVRIYQNLSSIEDEVGINKHALCMLFSKKEMIPWKRKCFQDASLNRKLKWPDYPKEILDVYEQVHASDRPVKITDKEGNVEYYPNVTKWCLQDRSNHIDPAVLCRYLKRTNRWRDWVFEHIDLNKYLHEQSSN